MYIFGTMLVTNAAKEHECDMLMVVLASLLLLLLVMAVTPLSILLLTFLLLPLTGRKPISGVMPLVKKVKP
jgi:hypothetical protein